MAGWDPASPENPISDKISNYRVGELGEWVGTRVGRDRREVGARCSIRCAVSRVCLFVGKHEEEIAGRPAGKSSLGTWGCVRRGGSHIISLGALLNCLTTTK